MIRLFYGGDRVAARKMIDRLLGDDYEVIEAESIERADMDSIFFGTSIFGDARKILIKDLSENKSCWEVVLDYIKTPHNIIIWNTTLDARTTVYKSLKAAKVEMKEFKAAEDPDKFIAFEAIQAAMRGDAKTALMKCKKMELKEEPYMVIGAFASEAYKTFATSRKAREAVRILAKADMDMKSAAVEPWSIAKIALVKIANL